MPNIKRIEELESLIKKYASSYYTGFAEVSDEYFDGLVEELSILNPGSDLFDKPGWGYEPKEKVLHLYDLTIGSLSKIHDASEIPESFGRHFFISPKLDGLSVVSYYLNGKRIKAVTRGNGKVGQNVTAKMHVISPITDNAPDERFTGAIRGEVVIECSAWNELVKKYGLEESPSANPRNYAAGILNRNSIDEDFGYLTYVPYKIIAEDWGHHLSHIDENDAFLCHWNGVRHVDAFADCMTLDEINWELKSRYDAWCEKYPCDGVVLTSEDISQDESNEKINVFREVAFKFPAESKKVVVTDVTWGATRTGRMQPRIWFDPISLSGATVQKCTGFNTAFIRDNKINKGTVIEITRANEVIPHLKKIVSNPATEGLLPTKCPNCGNTDLVWSGDDLICENENESQLAYRFITTAAPVDGCGWSLYTEYLDLNEISTLDSLVNFIRLVRLSTEDSVGRIRKQYHKITADKLVKITDKLTYPIDPVSFLVGCNIKGISWNSVSSLLTVYPEFITDIRNRSVDWTKVSSVPGFGYKTVVSLQKFEERVRQLAEVCLISAPVAKKETELKFKVAITGSLSMKRSDFENLLSEKGIFTGSNFKEIKYLITNTPDSTSSKMKKAKDNGVEIISEVDFFERYLK